MLRSDLRFLSLFFLIRIAFHLCFFVDIARPSSRAVTEGSWVPTIMLALALAMHVSWFRGGLNGFLKRRRAALEAGLAGRMPDPAAQVKTRPGQQETVRFEKPVGDVAITLDALTAGTVLPGSSPSRTPDDSPLLTPYTPSSTTPMSLRDSYILPALPSLQLPSLHIPAIPALPAMIPQIPSVADLTTAWQKRGGPDVGQFKDAVRHRWEEQRERFGAMAMGRAEAGRGRAKAMSLGRLDLRKRNARHDEQQATVTVQEVDLAE